ncbi:MAG: pirin family protein [Candidatus Cyclobacteriaceae bacterium M2_1C_046]
MRTIKKIHKAENAPMGDLKTHRALPTHSIDYIDPFLFLNHHGPQIYKPKNRGLPFGPHPHRGMETVTFILEGDIAHKDSSSGKESVIKAGGVQWMTAGSGLIHTEVSSEEFREKGGHLEILQLWINLPASKKMINPVYKGLQKKAIPSVILDNGKIELELLSGSWDGQKAAFESISKVQLNVIRFVKEGEITIDVPLENNIFFYIIKGKLAVGEKEVQSLHLVEFNNDGQSINIKAQEDSILLFGHARPFNEPVVAQGPFVMNTQEEIMQAYQDYQEGKFGRWE